MVNGTVTGTGTGKIDSNWETGRVEVRRVQKLVYISHGRVDRSCKQKSKSWFRNPKGAEILCRCLVPRPFLVYVSQQFT
jgi:hypothetical protein